MSKLQKKQVHDIAEYYEKLRDIDTEALRDELKKNVVGQDGFIGSVPSTHVLGSAN